MGFEHVLQSALPVMQALVIIVLGALGGIAWSFVLWLMPIIMLPVNDSRTMITQFNETTRRGGRYLQPTTQTIAVAMVLITFLTSRHPDPKAAAKWKLYLSVGLVMIQALWWEIVFIFPINRRIEALGRKFEEPGYQLSEMESRQVVWLMNRWIPRHAVRASVPLVACAIAVYAVMS